MKKIILALSIFTSMTSFAAINISKDCAKAIKENQNLEKQLRSIEINVIDFSLDNSKGYSEKTGEVLAKMACAPFVKNVEEAQVDVCNSIVQNVKSYEADKEKGFSPSTARLLNQMNGNTCF